MVQLSIGDEFNLPNVTAFDEEDGDLTNLIEINKSSIEEFYDSNLGKYIFNVQHEYEVIYTVLDSSNNQTTKILTIIVISDDPEGIIISFYKGPILLKQVPHLADEAFDPKLIAKEAGYNFKKWYTDANLTTPFDERTVIHDSITLYGDWYDFNTELDGYYRNLPYGLSGNDLRTTLQGILQDTINPRTYGEARFILAHSDRYYQDNYESVRGIYDNAVIATYWIGTGTGAWQREHVWPQSKLNGDASNNSRNDASDLHNLRAITGINQTKSNNYFIEGSGSARNINTGEFYPGDGHQGDSARILYYMELMYSYLTLTDDISLITGGGTYYGKLTPLLDWHYKDPVDQFEIERNEFIYSGIAIETEQASPTPTGRTIAPQANRNPFIDLPYLAYILWGDV